KELLRKLLPFDHATRSLDAKASFGLGLGGGDLRQLIDGIKQLEGTLLRSDEEMLAAEIGERARYRAVFMLLPEECLHEQPSEDKPLIRRHLENLGVPAEEDVVRAIKFVCECFRATRGSRPKLSVTDVFTRHRHVYDQLFDRQKGRCAF